MFRWEQERAAATLPYALPPPPTPPHKGRAIAYGFALVVFARIEGKPSRCRHTATESNPEQNRIQCGTTELPLRSDPSRKVKYGRNFSICDSPALVGRGWGWGSQ